MSVPRNDSLAAISSLASDYGDEESDTEPVSHEVDNISGSDDESVKQEKPKQKRPLTPTEEEPKKVLKKRATKLVSYGPDDIEDEEERDEDAEDVDEGDEHNDSGDAMEINYSHHPSSQDMDSSQVSDYLSNSLPSSVLHLSPDEISLPPEPLAKCSRRLQEKIADFERRRRRGVDHNESIQRRKDFRNPSIYEKLIEHCGINEKGTNYPPELYNPVIWGPESFYDELAKAQKVEMDKREKERKERTKVEFVTGTKKPGTELGDVKRKSKWDTQAAPGMLAGRPTVMTTTTVNPPTVSVTTSASGTKTKVISAVGALSKKGK